MSKPKRPPTGSADVTDAVDKAPVARFASRPVRKAGGGVQQAQPVKEVKAVKPGKQPPKAAPAAPAAPASPAGSATPAPASPKAERGKDKLVRDSFTMPRADFALIEQLKGRALAFQRPAKKSELLRAGLQALAALSDKALKARLDALPQLKTGRPRKLG